MKTYKLKKDLPLAEAGTIVSLEDTPIESSVKLIFDVNQTEHPLCTIYEKELNEWLEEIPEKPKSVWDLEKYDRYYFLENGKVENVGHYEYPNDIFRIKEGNAFLTYEEAEQELRKKRAIQRIKKYCWENDIETSRKIDYDLERTEDKEYYQRIYFHHLKNRFVCGDARFDCAETLEFFKSTNDALQVIKNCEDDLKIIFNI